MSRRSTLGGVLASASVLAIAGWAGAGALPAQSSSSTTTTAHAGSAADQTNGTEGANSTSGGGSVADGTYTGDVVATRFGDVQVQVQLSGGQITDVTPLHLTDRDGRSVSISNRAAPVLRQEVLTAQSSAVSMVSGATYTSEGYLTSLQSALDQAGF